MIPYFKALLSDEQAFRYAIRAVVMFLGAYLTQNPEALGDLPAAIGPVVIAAGAMVRSAPKAAAS